MFNRILLFTLAIAIISCAPTQNPTSDSQPTQEVEAPVEVAAPKALFQNINSAGLPDLFDQYPNVQLLDVRTSDEFAEGSIPDAKQMDVLQETSFLEQIETLDKNAPTLVFCRSGGRSVTACNLMAQKGFTNLYNLEGGYSEYSQQ